MPSNPLQHALKGQKLLAQGIALGIKAMSNAPCKGNSFKDTISSTPSCMVEITQHALKGQKLIAQGNALGINDIQLTP